MAGILVCRRGVLVNALDAYYGLSGGSFYSPHLDEDGVEARRVFGHYLEAWRPLPRNSPLQRVAVKLTSSLAQPNAALTVSGSFSAGVFLTSIRSASI